MHIKSSQNKIMHATETNNTSIPESREGRALADYPHLQRAHNET